MVEGLDDASKGYGPGMPQFTEEFALLIDAYEAGFRAAADIQLHVARVIDVEPVRAFAATYADLTRDIVATQVSSARWLLDV